MQNQGGISRMQKRVQFIEYWMVPVLSIAAAIGLNVLLLLVDLARFSPAYQEAASILYEVPFARQILVTGLLMPLIEEVCFRKIMYQLLKKWTTVVVAMCVSSLLFGLYHGNLVQFVYATICGFLLAYFYEAYGNIWACILAHMCMNLIACILTKLEVLSWIMGDVTRAIAVISLMFIIFILVFIRNFRVSKKWMLQKC